MLFLEKLLLCFSFIWIIIFKLKNIIYKNFILWGEHIIKLFFILSVRLRWRFSRCSLRISGLTLEAYNLRWELCTVLAMQIFSQAVNYRTSCSNVNSSGLGWFTIRWCWKWKNLTQNEVIMIQHLKNKL